MKLSICIPTFNRKEELERTIDAIQCQNAHIEICVSDNGTEKPDRDVEYRRNGENLGFDRNVIKSVEMASGDWVWLMSDDDTLKDGVVERVLVDIEEAEKTGITAILANATNDQDRPSEIGSGFTIHPTKNHPKCTPAFIGSIILQRKGAMEAIERKKTWEMEGFTHAELFLDIVERSESFGIEATPLIKMTKRSRPMSYKSKLEGDINMLNFIIKMKASHPNFHPDDFSNISDNTRFIHVGVACAAPENLPLFRMASEAYQKILNQDLEDSRLMMSFIENFLVRVPVLNRFVGTLFELEMKRRGSKLQRK